jgi:hypothetical protein
LASAFSVLAGAASAGSEKLHDYVGVEKCRTCHEKELIGNQVGALSEGPHRRAYETLTEDASLAIAKGLGIATLPQESEACLRCHVTAYGVPAVRIASPLAYMDGVQCESCHGPGRDYRKKQIMSDRARAAKKGLWDASRDEAICTGCHNSESPTYDPARYLRPDGTTSGFDFEIAKGRIAHAIPADVKGRFVELEAAEKAARKAAGR